MQSCQFIEAEPLRHASSDHLKCGKPCVPGKPYCPECYRRCCKSEPTDESEEAEPAPEEDEDDQILAAKVAIDRVDGVSGMPYGGSPYAQIQAREMRVRRQMEAETRAAQRLASMRLRASLTAQFAGVGIHMPSGRISASDVISAVCEAYQIERADLLGPRKSRQYARPRQVAMFLCRRHCKHLSMPAIARELCRGDHTTVLHGIRQIEGLILQDPDLAAKVWQAEKLCVEAG